MRFLEHARRSSFIRHNGVLFIGAAAVGALNYLYYPVMGRLLNTTSFGEVQTLVSLFLQVTIFLSVLGLVTTNIVTNYTSAERRNAIVLEFEKLALVISVTLLALTIVFQGVLARFLQFDSGVPFVLLMAALVASVPLTFRSAFLRGTHHFGMASAVNLWSAGGKLVLAALLVLIGLQTAGAIGALIIAQLLAGGFAIVWATRQGLRRPTEHKRLGLPNVRLLKPELRYGLLVLVGSLIIALQYSIDVVVVKHYFDPHMAGLYAGLASVARIIFFLTASISLVLMSMVRLQATAHENRKLLVKSMTLLLLVGLPILLLCVLVPQQILGLLMGRTYEGIAALLPRLSLAIFAVSIVNLVTSYYLALRKYALAPVLIIGAGLTYGLMYANHATLGAVVNNLLIGSIVMLGTLGLWAGSMRIKEQL